MPSDSSGASRPLAFAALYDGAGDRIDLFLSRATGHSRAFVQVQIGQGRVLLNGVAVARPAARLQNGDKVEARFDETGKSELTPVEGSLTVLYEDEDLLVVNKDAGVVVHPAPGTTDPTLVHFLLHRFGESEESEELQEATPDRPGIVHRLDRGTSGCLVVAKNRFAQEKLSAQFKDRITKKEYEALCWGLVPAKGEVKTDVGRDRLNRKKMSSKTDRGREALTRYERVEAFGHASFVRLFPHTGRTHQLRVHLSELKHPILGDEMYGGRLGKRLLPDVLRPAVEALPFTLLHAAKLSFLHPRDERPIEVSAPRPTLFEEMLTLFRTNDPPGKMPELPTAPLLR